MGSPSPRSTDPALTELTLNGSVHHETDCETDVLKLCDALSELPNVGQASRLTRGVSPVGERRDTPCAPSEDRRDACPTLAMPESTPLSSQELEMFSSAPELSPFNASFEGGNGGILLFPCEGRGVASVLRNRIVPAWSLDRKRERNSSHRIKTWS